MIKETVSTGKIRFEFNDRLKDVELIITDTDTGHSVVLSSEDFGGASSLDKMKAESMLREFSRKI